MTINVYVNPGCQSCTATLRKLKDLGAEYTVLQAAKHPQEIRAAKALGYTTAPIVAVSHGEHEDTIIAGYDPDALVALVGEVR